jgi:hypothetical protein
MIWLPAAFVERLARVSNDLCVISACQLQLKKVLCDSAEHRRVLETIGRCLTWSDQG